MSGEREVVVVSGVRTAIGDYGGGLKDMPPTELAGQVIKEAVKRAKVDQQSGFRLWRVMQAGDITCRASPASNRTLPKRQHSHPPPGGGGRRCVGGATALGDATPWRGHRVDEPQRLCRPALWVG
jgi:hypothetical protein